MKKSNVLGQGLQCTVALNTKSHRTSKTSVLRNKSVGLLFSALRQLSLCFARTCCTDVVRHAKTDDLRLKAGYEDDPPLCTSPAPPLKLE